jgi:transcription antitermination factor NusG
MELNDETWHIVKGTRGSPASSGAAATPTPISDEEVARMTAQIKEGAVEAEAQDPVRGGRERAGRQRPVRELLRASSTR